MEIMASYILIGGIGMTINEKVVGFFLGGAAIGYSVYLHWKMKKTTDKLGLTLDKLASATNVEVNAAVVNAAIEKAVDREVGPSVVRASNIAVKRVTDNMEGQIRKAVNASYENVEKSVSSEISKQVARLDISKLREEVTIKAKEAVLEKFNGSLDGVLEQFNGNLENVSKIYRSITNSLTKEQKGVTLKID